MSSLLCPLSSWWLNDGASGNLFERMPKILRIMANDGLFVTPATAQKLLSKAVENNKLSAAKEILAVLDAQKIKVVDETRLLVQGGEDGAKGTLGQ